MEHWQKIAQTMPLPPPHRYPHRYPQINDANNGSD